MLVKIRLIIFKILYKNIKQFSEVSENLHISINYSLNISFFYGKLMLSISLFSLVIFALRRGIPSHKCFRLIIPRRMLKTASTFNISLLENKIILSKISYTL